MFKKSPFEKDPRYLKAIHWIWAHNKMDIAFGQSVVTEENRKFDLSTINPPLNNSEAINLFEFLERKELLYKQQNGWIINKVERNKWIDLTQELKRPDWTRSWLAKSTYSLILFMGSGFLGALIAIESDHLFSQDRTKKCVCIITEDLSGAENKGKAQKSAEPHKSDGEILQKSNIKTVTTPTPNKP